MSRNLRKLHTGKKSAKRAGSVQDTGALQKITKIQKKNQQIAYPQIFGFANLLICNLRTQSFFAICGFVIFVKKLGCGLKASKHP